MADRTMYETYRRAAEPDRGAVLEVLTAAFMDDPVLRWLFPDEDDRVRLQPDFYRPLLTHPKAEAYLIGRPEGAAIWLTLGAGQAPYEEPADRPAADPSVVFGANAARLWELGRHLVGRHPDEQAHLYLPCMGVLAGRQGGGLGSAMLRHRLDRADDEGLPAYLEASSPRSRSLYLRHGFADLGGPVHLPDGPTLWPMWRRPSR